MSRFVVVSIFYSMILVSGILASNTALSAPADDFVTTWKTDNPGTSNATSITVPIIGGLYDVDWDNDLIFDEFGLSGSTTHDYGETGTFSIRIRGSYDSIRFDNGGDKEKILSIDQWGTLSWTTMRSAFYGAKNLQVLATDTPDFSAVQSMGKMFQFATLANPNTANWDTSAVTAMNRMFFGASSANPNTSKWDTAKVTNMAQMFRGATLANPDTSNWDTSRVIDMGYMFYGATSANPNTGKWDTGAVVSMSRMFFGATSANPNTSGWDTGEVKFMSHMFWEAKIANPNTSSWDTSAVVTMYAMFEGAAVADPDTSAWDTSEVTTTQFMFYNARSANPDTSGWNTAAIKNMRLMFTNATSANPDTSKWNTSSVTDMGWMFFGATSAIPDTSGWDTSVVTDMYSMFKFATSANPDTRGWDTGAVTTMYGMFWDAIAFDQDIGSWDVTSLTNSIDMFKGVSLSVANYDSLLIGWDTQALQAGVTFSGGNSKFCSASAIAARANMISSDGWSITDGGQVLECPPAKPGLAPDLTPATDTGVSHNDNLTLDNTPDFFIECSTSGNTITLYTDVPTVNTAIGSHICTAAGIEIATVTTALPGGIHSITYTDKDGNGESGHSPSLAVNIDLIFTDGFEDGV